MSRQDKAITERHTRTLRELVKRPENKVCADCKRNDPRWASWNLGVFLCIRCSGIHRGMGTHISKVKSVDLDTWTPDQMQSIQKWGNYLANLYWEAHLKPGHVPPEHKMESFIRSKYESRRWAKEGPLPSDPSTLDDGSSGQAEVAQERPSSAAAAATRSSTSTQRAASPATTTQSASRSTHTHQLLSTAHSNRATSSPPAVAAPVSAAKAPSPAPAPENDLFSLDFHAPPISNTSTTNNTAARKDVKQDILSLFSTSSNAPTASAANPAAFGQFGAGSSPWAQPGVPAGTVQPQAQQTSMMGNNGTGMWGTSSGWGGNAPVAPAQGNLWGPSSAAQPLQNQNQPGLTGTSNLWAAPATAGGAAGPSVGGAGNSDLFGNSFAGSAPAKKDDVFGDLWGEFK